MVLHRLLARYSFISLSIVATVNHVVVAFSTTASLRTQKVYNERESAMTLHSVVEDKSVEDNKDVVDGPVKASAPQSSASPFANFDYNAHWYPVTWARDIPLNEPTKVTVFDTDYVVARTSENDVVCLQDRCPHKAAALSQGRVTGTGNIMCAYHGWSFDGKTGECTDIPQIFTLEEGNNPKIPSRSCAQAVPVQIHQQMVWIFPGGGLEKALQAAPPPTIPELEDPDFKMTQAIRDFPVDWPILLSNIVDPDHGAFAHQSKNFDMYTASTQFPMTIQEEFPDNSKGWTIRAKVDSDKKLLQVDQKLREANGEKVKKKNNKKKDVKETPWATSYLHAPNHVQLKRVDKKENKASFATVFYVCPVGVGRSRFMSAAVGKSAIPRFLIKLMLDNFLDQDTYLLATQQQYILNQEARDVQDLMASSEEGADITNAIMPTRRKLFCLTSPTEKLVSRLEQFWDHTLLRSPNRIPRLLQLYNTGAFASVPPREVVLDRKRQQLDICKDSQDVERNCRRVSSLGKLLGWSSLVAKLVWWNNKRAPWLLAASALSFGAAWLAEKLRKEYYFKYTDKFRQRDLRKIPKEIWSDK